MIYKNATVKIDALQVDQSIPVRRPSGQLDVAFPGDYIVRYANGKLDIVRQAEFAGTMKELELEPDAS